MLVYILPFLSITNKALKVYQAEYFITTLLLTVKHLIFAESKFGDFKRLTYWHISILAVSQLNPL